MSKRIEAVAKESTENEARRMKELVKIEMVDSAKLYTYLVKKVQPKLGALMGSNSQLKDYIQSRVHYVDVLYDYTTRVSHRHQRQVQVL